MVTYIFRCNNCNIEEEKEVSMGTKTVPCKICESNMVRTFHNQSFGTTWVGKKPSETPTINMQKEILDMGLLGNIDGRKKG